MRKFFITIGIILAVLILAVIVFAATFDVNKYRGAIQSQLERRTGRKVLLGEMRLSLFPPRFTAQDLTISEDPAFGMAKPFVQTQQLDVSVKLLPLFSGNAEIDSLDLQHPSVELIKNQQGVWSVSSLGGPSQSSSTNQGGTPASPSAQPQSSVASGQQAHLGGQPQSPPQSGHQFSLARLSISDGQLAVTDLQAGTPRAMYDHIDATISDFAPNSPFTLDIAAHLPGAPNQEIRLQGQTGPLANGQLLATPFHGTLELKQVEIAGLRKFLDSPALANLDAVISGQTQIINDAGTLAATGNINVQNARISGRDLGYPVTAVYDFNEILATEVLTVRNTTLTLGSTPLSMNGTVNAKATPPEIDLHLKADNVTVKEAARLAAAFGVGLAPGTTVDGMMSADLHARGAATKPALSGTISGRDLQLTGKDIPQPIEVPSVNLVLTPDEIRSENFNMISGGTSVAAQFALRQYLAKSPQVDATLRAPNAALPEVLALAKAYGMTSLDQVSGAGNLNLDLHAAGPLQSISSDDITRALNGTLKLSLNNMRYSGADLSHELGGIAGFLVPGGNAQGFTNISRLTGDVVVKNGVAQTNNLLALLDIGNVGAVGTANLVTQALDLRLTAVLSKEFSQRVGGTGIGGYLNTALANNQSELVIPMIVSGTLQHPRFAPDVQKLAQMRLQGLIPNSNDPLAGLNSVLGNLLKKKGTATDQQQPQQPNPLQQLFDTFGKKKKPQPPQ